MDFIASLQISLLFCEKHSIQSGNKLSWNMVDNQSLWLRLRIFKTCHLLQEIAQTKLPDLNCTKIESAMKVIAGTARNMGIKIREEVAS